MFEKEITPYQNISILILASFAFQIMSMPALLSGIQGPAGWAAVVGGAAILILTLGPVNKVMSKYKGMTIVDIAGRVLPPAGAKAIGAYYITLFILAGGILLKDFAEQIKLLMLFQTPKSVIIIIILLTASYAAKKGIQTIAQISHMTVLLGLIPFMAVIVFSALYSNITNVLPVWPLDFKGIWGTIPYTVFGFLGYSVLMFSNPYVKGRPDNSRLNKLYIYISGGLYIFCYLLIIVKFGRIEAQRLVWPFISILKFVNIPGFFFENTEALGIYLQIVVIFTCLCILMYFTNHALQETFGTRENGYFIFIQIPILYLVAVILPGMYRIYKYLEVPAYILSGLSVAIPLIVVAADIIKSKSAKSR